MVSKRWSKQFIENCNCGFLKILTLDNRTIMSNLITESMHTSFSSNRMFCIAKTENYFPVFGKKISWYSSQSNIDSIQYKEPFPKL